MQNDEKPILNISFSGGRTSAYMTHMLLTHKASDWRFVVLFANTGMEHPKTLEFIRNCDDFFGFNTVWLEADVHPDKGHGTGYKIVDYATASRDGTPYRRMVEKYGIPNVSFPHCTRELKLAPMRRYLSDMGIPHRTVPTAIGIRRDESRRVSKSAEAENIIYPLIDTFPVDKQDVLDWWEDQPFDLEIEEFEGNCLGCFKKSKLKHFWQMQKNVDIYRFYADLEAKHGHVGPHQLGNRVFYRGNQSTVSLLREFRDARGNLKPWRAETDHGGCSESCEVYELTVEEILR